jgi:hypothetical protein
MEISSLLVEQRRTGDEYRIAESNIRDLQKALAGKELDALGRARTERAMFSSLVELARIGRRMLDLDASLVIAVRG